MNTRIFFLLVLIIGGLSVFLFTPKQKQELVAKEITNKKTPTIQTAKTFTPQNKTMGAVEVSITPLSVTPGDKPVFQLGLNTHSANLDYDFTKIVTLRDDQDNLYKALSWKGGKGGHHLSGELIFEPLQSELQTITIKIKRIDNQSAEFTWIL